jgi:hypothetical protein
MNHVDGTTEEEEGRKKDFHVVTKHAANTFFHFCRHPCHRAQGGPLRDVLWELFAIVRLLDEITFH